MAYILGIGVVSSYAKIEMRIVIKPVSANTPFFYTPFLCTIKATIEPANISQARVGKR